MTTITTAQQSAWTVSCQRRYESGGHMAIMRLMFGQWLACEALTLDQAINWSPRDRNTEAIRHMRAEMEFDTQRNPE